MNKKNVETIYPLSPTQQGMLFATVCSPNSGIHIEQLSCRLQGHLNPLAFEQAWQRVVERHSALRTGFVWRNLDEPRQVVLRQVEVKLNQQDWLELLPSVQQDYLENYFDADRRQGFNLSQPPLMRLALFQLDRDSYQFVWTHHHILMDGWCLFILFRELLSFYQAINQQQELRLPPTRPYKDYITWLKQQALPSAEAFWRQTLQGFTHPTSLGTPAKPDSLSTPLPTYGEQTASLPTAETAKLQALARQHRITLNTLIQGVWALLLSRYSNTTDVLFGITVSGRPADLVGSESMIGPFINTLPLRIEIDPEASLWSWLQEIYAHNLHLRQYEHSPAGQVYQWSDLPGTLPLYESLLVFENYPVDYSILKSPDLGIDVRHVDSRGAQTQYPLTILVSVDSECKFVLIHNRRRLDSVDVSLILQHLLIVLHSIATDKTLSLAKLLAKIPTEQIPRFRIKPKSNPEKSKNLEPSTPIEEILVKIWTQVLGIAQIGIDDNFFDLGGHSLLATQVMSQVRGIFQVELPLRHLFEAPTIGGLAQRIEMAQQTESGQKTPPLVPIPRDRKLPLSFAQARLWFLAQLQSESSSYNETAAIRLVGNLNVRGLEQSLNEIVRRHEVLRTTFAQVDGEPFQVIAPILNLPLSIVNLRHLPEAERQVALKRLMAEESQHPFDLERGPLLRCRLVRVSEQEHIALFTIHHIVSDGWSMGVLVRELAALYEAFCADKPSPLPELPIQYADFAVWQRQWLQAEVLEAQLAYWKQQLGSHLPVLQLPTVRPREEVKTNRGATQSFRIPANLSKALQALSHQEGVTLFMTLLAGFQVLLQRYTHQDDIVVGTDVANRNRAETDPLIGFFVNLLVLRTDLSENPSFRELLKRVREVALGAYAHQDLPFDKLVDALQPKRKSSHTPLFQVLFVLQNAPMPPLELPGLTLSLLEVDNEIARFDLVLFLTETDQGIEGKWQYHADLFEAATINRMSGQLETLLKNIVAQPDARINTLEMITETEKEQQAVKKQNKITKLKQFLAVQPQAVDLSQEKLIKTGYLSTNKTLPFVIQPNIEGVCVIQWIKSNRELIESELLKHGAILFRGFDISSVSEFERLAEAICPSLFGEYGDLPRKGVSGKVYSSTPYPSDQAILFHNESSHIHCWPQKIWFFCVQPSQLGGETPIVDCRKIFQLLDPKLRERFEQKQLMYVRNYTNGLDVSWQDFFHTTDKNKVEDYCRKASIHVEWKSDGGLRTCQVRPAIIQHPQTGESVFFNQIQLHHASYLKPEVRESLLSTFSEDNLPRHVYYGDHSPIEDSVIEEIMAVYQNAQVSFPWQRGDVLMLDNMLTAHGRNPYVGNRKIVVAMGEMVQGY